MLFLWEGCGVNADGNCSMMGSARVFEAWEKEKEKSEEGADESRES
jgi:hypothetical protein